LRFNPKSYQKHLNAITLLKRRINLLFTRNKEIKILKVTRGTNPGVTNGYEYIYWDIKNFLYLSINGIKCFNDSSVLFYNPNNEEISIDVVGWNRKEAIKLVNENDFELNKIYAPRTLRLNYPHIALKEVNTKLDTQTIIPIHNTILHAPALKKLETKAVKFPTFKLKNYVK